MKHTTDTRTRWPLVLLCALVLALAGCALGPPAGVQPVDNFRLAAYLGHWYEIARLDHRFERNMTDVSARYSQNADGSLHVINRGFDTERMQWRQAEGRARFIGDAGTGSLKVSFFGPFYGGYHVAALDADYRWALVIGPDPSYAWILARERTLTESARSRILAQAARAGVDTQALIWVSHDRLDPAPPETAPASAPVPPAGR